jgi:mannose-6-phosphate isomerase-like protein (cupin superfamily)
MAIKINKPAVIESEGNKPKRIEEYIGGVNSGTSDVSIARMVSPSGWEEPGQIPEFSEYTVVLNGMLRVKTKSEVFDVYAGEAIVVNKNEWVQYSTPGAEGAEYIAVCVPAFSPDTVHRDRDADSRRP